MAEAGPLHPNLVDAIEHAIAVSHLVAPPVPAEPWINSIPGIIKGNTAAFRTASCFAATDIDDLGDALQSAFFRMRGLLEQRGRQGYVRRCHGDLHLANIVLIEQKPVVTGASRGLGLAMAEGLAEAGATVLLNGERTHA